MSDLTTCDECGHVRYAGNQFNGLCATCEMWAEDQIVALRAEAAALKAKLARYEGDLTERQKSALVETCPKTALTLSMSRYGWDIVDAAIRKVRGEP
jgi:uncharacterized Zn finger protein (UPF0148 family)